MARGDRLERVVGAVAGSVKRAVVEERITEDELWEAIRFLTEVGRNDEFALLSDVLGISVQVDRITHGEEDGATASNVLGPFYVQGAPLLEPPYLLASPEEPGEPLRVTGRVTDSRTATPLPDAVLDVWQATADGKYSNQDPDLGEFHLRGKIPTDDDAGYEFRTVIPPPYEIPKDGPVGRLLRTLDRHAFRPAHLHLKVSCPGYASLTTMVYFRGDEYLRSDTIDSVKDSLIVSLERDSRPDGSGARCRFDVALRAI